MKPWFQIHLSTALILTSLASGLLWANISPTLIPSALNRTEVIENRGWPVVFYSKIPLSILLFFSSDPDVYADADGISKERWHADALAANVLVGLLMLFVAGYVLERRIRRKDRAKMGVNAAPHLY